MDNEVDDIFKESLGQIKIDPPKEFWDEATERILARSNKPVKSSSSLWRSIAFVLFALVLVLSSLVFYFYKEARNNGNDKPMATVENVKNPEVVSNSEHAESTQNIISNTNNKTVGTTKPIQSAIAYSEPHLNRKKSITSHASAHEEGTMLVANTHKNIQNYNEQNYSVNSADNKKPITNSVVESNSSDKALTEVTASNNNVQVASPTVPKDPLVSTQRPDTTKKAEPQYVNSQVLKTTPANIAVAPKDTLKLVNTPSGGLAIAAYFAPHVMDKCIYKGTGSSSEISGNDLKNYEKSNFCYTTGIKAEIALSRHWSVSAGVSYSSFSSRYSPEEVYYQKQSDGSAGYAVVTSSGVVECPNYGWGKPGDSLSISGTSSRNYVGISLLVKYRFAVSNKLDFYMTTGGAANFAIQSVTTMHWQDSWQKTGNATANSIDELKTAYYSFYFGIGAEYNISRRFSLYAEPSLQGGITPMSKNPPIVSYPYSIPIAFGAVYHLK